MRWDARELITRLRKYDRSPFQDLLAIWLESMPDAASIEAFAKRAPDKYAMSLGQIARVAGYTEKIETQHNVNINIGNMSDSQVEDELRKRMQELGVVDATYEEVTQDVPETQQENAEADRETGDPGIEHP